MTISRMQQPRQMYGLGSIVKKAVKGVTGAVKDFVKSDLGKAALIGGGLYLGGGTGGLSSLFSKIPGSGAIGEYLGTKGGKTLLMAGAGTLLGGLTAKAEQGDPNALAATRDVGALRNYLFEGYKNLGYTDDQAQELTNKDTAEYTSGQGGYATGGRVGYADGTDETPKEKMFREMKNAKVQAAIKLAGEKNIGIGKAMAITNEDDFNLKTGKYEGSNEGIKKLLNMKAMGGRVQYSDGSEGPDDLYSRSYKRVMELMDEGYDFGSAVKKYMEEERENKAYGGKMGDVVDQASGIMGLPQRVNQAGVKELDLRKSGGFIPPVGIKEKADDIPAMLSNNEFVMTADSVKSMGEGDVNKGAQRMYDMMKALEKRIA